jgi:hypothetical protein
MTILSLGMTILLVLLERVHFTVMVSSCTPDTT